MTDSLFTNFHDEPITDPPPEKFTFPFAYQPHSLCIAAAKQLQSHLETQTEWQHNFGLGADTENIIGKMFGVLVVKNSAHEIGFLSAFSGKLANSNHLPHFVPPVYDLLDKEGFFQEESLEINQMNARITQLETQNRDDPLSSEINELKQQRKQLSSQLQRKIFQQYQFLNSHGVRKDLNTIFITEHQQNPPAGAGECAAPKLLQYAFLNQLTPLSLAEFWWGSSPKSENRKHGEFYPSCLNKCLPILTHMLEGIEVDPPPYSFIKERRR